MFGHTCSLHTWQTILRPITFYVCEQLELIALLDDRSSEARLILLTIM